MVAGASCGAGARHAGSGLLVEKTRCKAFVADPFESVGNHAAKSKPDQETAKSIIFIFEASGDPLKLRVGFDAHLVIAATTLLQIPYSRLSSLAKLPLRFAFFRNKTIVQM